MQLLLLPILYYRWVAGKLLWGSMLGEGEWDWGWGANRRESMVQGAVRGIRLWGAAWCEITAAVKQLCQPKTFFY